MAKVLQWLTKNKFTTGFAFAVAILTVLRLDGVTICKVGNTTLVSLLIDVFTAAGLFAAKDSGNHSTLAEVQKSTDDAAKKPVS